MINRSLRIKILSGLLCTGLALSSTSITFAAVGQNGNSNEMVATSMDVEIAVDKENAEQSRYGEMKDTLEVVIKESVQSNIITSDEGKKVLEYVTLKSDKKCAEDKNSKIGKCGGEKGGLFNELVTAKILTVEKSDALRERVHLKKTEIRAEELQKGLNILVVNKVLTTEQKDKVEKAIMTRDAQRKEDYQKMKNMNEKERKEYMKKIKETKINPMKVLIDNGTITKEQDKEIQKILFNHKHGEHNHK